MSAPPILAPARRLRFGLQAPKRVARDHALVLHRFIGGAQMLGGATLVANASSGDRVLTLQAAPQIIVALGVLQIFVGLYWLAQVAVLRRFVHRRPGLYAAIALGFAIATIALGGSGIDLVWITSAQCALVAAGVVLPGIRVVVATVVVAAVASALWVLVDGPRGGYHRDGAYVVAILAMAKVVIVGLWLGRVTGRAIELLERWHVIELHERGAVQLLRVQLARVDHAAATLARRLADLSLRSGELVALQVRLRRGVDLPIGSEPVPLAALFAQLVDEHAGWDPPVGLEAGLSVSAEGVTVDAVVAAEIAAVARRQIDNVGRHAPQATVVQLRADRDGETLHIRLEDDGGGTAPARTGGGTAWSARQLRRVGGTARYYDAPSGVGLDVALPMVSETALSDVPGLSVADGLRAFANNLFVPIRLSGYIGDTVYVASVDGIDARWILMPIGAILIELALRRGLPWRRLSAEARPLLAAAIAVALVAVFTIPAGSPDTIVPATTSVIVLSQLIVSSRPRAWLVAELGRLAAYAPLYAAYGTPTTTLGIVYPAAFYALIYALRRFELRANGMEASVLDAVGRAALASATVRGLALHHDAVEVILRAAPDTEPIREAGGDLEDSVRALEEHTADVLDPRDVVRSGVQAALQIPAVVDRPGVPSRARGSVRSSALDRIALLEIVSLAAQERASCSPPGLLGRRRLQTIHLDWEDGAGGTVCLRLRAEPQLRDPRPARLGALVAVARAHGVHVHSSPDELRLEYTA